jgi:hypothetical protein
MRPPLYAVEGPEFVNELFSLVNPLKRYNRTKSLYIQVVYYTQFVGVFLSKSRVNAASEGRTTYTALSKTISFAILSDLYPQGM